MTRDQWEALKKLKQDLAFQAEAKQAVCDKHADNPDSAPYRRAEAECTRLLRQKCAL